MTTKKRILIEAFKMFSEKGYRGTNLRDLASSLSLSKSALYKHFASKEDIWRSLLEYMESYYSEHFDALSVVEELPRNKEEFVEMVMRTVRFTVNDEAIVRGRRLVESEAYRDPLARAFSSSHFQNKIRERYERIFAEMMEEGLIRQEDPEFLATLFVAPIGEYIRRCDREEEQKEVLLGKAESFTKKFIERIQKEGETTCYASNT